MATETQDKRLALIKSVRNNVYILGLLSSACFGAWQESIFAGGFLLSFVAFLYYYTLLILLSISENRQPGEPDE